MKEKNIIIYIIPTCICAISHK